MEDPETGQRSQQGSGEEAGKEEMGQRDSQTEAVGPCSLPGCLLQVHGRAGRWASARLGLGDRDRRPLPGPKSAEMRVISLSLPTPRLLPPTV